MGYCTLSSMYICTSLQVDKDLRTMLVKPDAPEPEVVGFRVWPRAIPQFNVGHLSVLEVRCQNHPQLANIEACPLRSVAMLLVGFS